MKRTALRRGRPLTRSTPLPAVSAKQAGHLRTYRVLRRAYLADHARCEFPGGCTELATEIQHRRGRRGGARLNDTAWWAPSCHTHNQWAETNTGEALACGWLVRIESTP